MNKTSNSIVTLVWLTLLIGCNSAEPPLPGQDAADAVSQDVENAAVDQATSHATSQTAAAPAGKRNFNVEQLLASRLPSQATSEGWVRLFDGYTQLGFQVSGDCTWSIEDQALVSNDPGKGLLCTTTKWRDYELTLEFRADADTNSGIFLRTPFDPKDPKADCYELNIAPADNPFPTGSLVGREKVEGAVPADFDFLAWHRLDVRVQGDRVEAQLDGREVLRFVDPNPLPAGLIGLQHNEGPIAFRDVRIRPLGLTSLLATTVEDQWNRYPDLEGDFQMTDDGLHVTGGRGQLESKSQYDDFALLAEVRTNAKGLNSGIFFRCIPGEQMLGYECQISNAMKQGDPMSPADCGSGGFFRRQDARIIAADDGDWFSMLLVADGPKMAAWVNGIQVSEWTDDRKLDDNPRKGLRLQAGTLMIQAHDPTTDIHIRQLQVAPLIAE